MIHYRMASLCLSCEFVIPAAQHEQHCPRCGCVGLVPLAEYLSQYLNTNLVAKPKIHAVNDKSNFIH